MTQTVEPRTSRGLRDLLSDQMLARQWMIDTIRGVYELYGFEPVVVLKVWKGQRWVEVLLSFATDELVVRAPGAKDGAADVSFLGLDRADVSVEEVRSAGPGQVLMVEVEVDPVPQLFTVCGDRDTGRLRATTVAEDQALLRAGLVGTPEQVAAERARQAIDMREGSSTRSMAPAHPPARTRCECVRPGARTPAAHAGRGRRPRGPGVRAPGPAEAVRLPHPDVRSDDPARRGGRGSLRLAPGGRPVRRASGARSSSELIGVGPESSRA